MTNARTTNIGITNASPTAPPGHPPGDAGLDPRRWWTLAVLCLSLLIVFIGNASLNVALPVLSERLHASSSQLQWVVAVYSLVFAGLLFSAGALGDRFGRKGALQLGLFVFLTGAALASAATSINQLIACRALMGAAAALIMPSTLSILVNVFPPHERTRAIAIWAGVGGGSAAIGPVASGFLLAHFWYGSVFLVNVPFVALALLTGRFLVPRSKDPEQARLDPVGAVLSIIGIASLVFGLIQAPERGWGSTSTLAAFTVAGVVLALFVAWELRVDEPMLEMALFRNAAFSAASGGMILVFLAMFGVMFLLTLYFQLVLGYSPLGAALRFLPMSPVMIIAASNTPKLAARFGAHRTVASGLVMVSIALFMFRGLDQHTSYLYLVACLVVMVTGMGIAMSPMTASIMSAVPPRRAGTGSAMNDATRELGAALGIAVLGSLAASHYRHSVDADIAGVPAASRSAVQGSLAGAIDEARTLSGPAARAVTEAARSAFVDAIHFTVTVGACSVAVAAAVVLRFLPHEAAHHDHLAVPDQPRDGTGELGVAGAPRA